MVHETTGRNPMLFTRAEPSLVEQVKRVADREFDGNSSMVVRIAIRRFVAEREAQYDEASDTSTEQKAA
jgi:hypothetical protein